MLEGVLEGVSTVSNRFDFTTLLIFGICIGIFVLVVGYMFYLVFKYHHTKVDKKDIKNITHNVPLEVAWTVIPTILVMIIFYLGLDSFKAFRTMPKDGIDIAVEGRKWSWTHTYENGKTTADLYVPVNTNIKLKMTAPKNDILHSYYVAAFRIKEDIVPGMTTYQWFNATKEGTYDIQCTEYCGDRHSYMLGKVYVVSQEMYDGWIDSNRKTPFDKDEAPAKSRGLELLEMNACLSCHSLDGSVLVGPSFKGIYNRNIKITDASGATKEIKSDEAYLKVAIVDPDKELVEGFAGGMMPPYPMPDEDITAIIDYLKTIQ